jgi:hypothetical protein
MMPESEASVPSYLYRHTYVTVCRLIVVRPAGPSGLRGRPMGVSREFSEMSDGTRIVETPNRRGLYPPTLHLPAAAFKWQSSRVGIIRAQR